MSTMTTGRRKEAIAKVRIQPGKGTILVNGRAVDDYFPRLALQVQVREPFVATQTMERFDCVAQVVGGGIAGQAAAIRHGAARALCVEDENFRAVLRKTGLLTRDSRVRERKKYGQKGARKRFQWTKR